MTIGAAKTTYTAHAAPTAHQSTRRSRSGSAIAYPATASASTAGTASSAVASEAVAMWAATSNTAKPAAGTSAPGNRTPASRSSRRPQPKDTAVKASGNSTQQTNTEVTGDEPRLSGQPPGARRAASGDGTHAAVA